MPRLVMALVYFLFLTAAALAQEGSWGVVGGPLPLRVVATGGVTANLLVSTGVGRDMIMSRLPHIMGGDASEIRFCYDNVLLTNNAPPGSVNGMVDNAVQVTIINAAIESDTLGKTIPLTFSGVSGGVPYSGSSSRVLAIGETQACSDPVYPGWFGLSKFSRDELYWSRQKASVPSDGFYWALGQNAPGGYAGAGVYDYATVRDIEQTYRSGPLTVGTGFVRSTVHGIYPGWGPTAVLGRFTKPGYPSVCVLGASWSSGFFDDNNTAPWLGTGLGMMAHAALNAGAMSNTIAFTDISHGGFGADDFMIMPAKAFWKFQYCNIVFDDLGGNDLSPGGVPPAGVVSNNQVLWNLAHVAGAQVIQMMMGMRTTSTSNCWFPANDQSYDTGFSAGATADQTNAALNTARAAGQVETLFDVAMSGINDSTDRWKWRSDGVTCSQYTNGGLHPNGLGYANIGVGLRSIINNLFVGY